MWNALRDGSTYVYESERERERERKELIRSYKLKIGSLFFLI